jgi:hypothetical protein
MAGTVLTRIGMSALCCIPLHDAFSVLSRLAVDLRRGWCMARRFYHRALEGHVPEINNAAHLRERAVNFRRLAKDYDEAGQRPVSDKLTEVAGDFDAQAAQLESKASGVPAKSFSP